MNAQQGIEALLCHLMANDSYDKLQAEHKAIGPVYWFFALALILLLVYMISQHEIDVVLKAEGLIRPETKELDITTSTSGVVTINKIISGAKIQKGELVFSLDDQALISRLESLREELKIDSLQLADYDEISRQPPAVNLRSASLKAQYEAFQIARSELLRKIDKEKVDYRRYSTLYENSVVSAEEFESGKLELDSLVLQLESLDASRVESWARDELTLKLRVQNLEAAIKETESQIRSCRLYSPFECDVISSSGPIAGSFYLGGAPIGTLSPNSGLVCEVVLPDFYSGSVTSESSVTLEFPALPRAVFGTLPGSIEYVGSDVVSNGKAYIRILRIRILDRPENASSIGKYLKRGMFTRAYIKTGRQKVIHWILQGLHDWRT